MEKKKLMWIAIIFLSLATIGLTIAVIFLATQDDAAPEVIITTTTANPSPSPGTTTVPTTTKTTTVSTTTLAPGEITDGDLRSFSEALLEADVNNKGQFVTVNLEADPADGETLLEVAADALNCPTMEGLINLSDNFKAPVDVDDNLGPEYMMEKEEFLNALMNTEIMKMTEDWMTAQGIFAGSNLTLVDVVDHVWFMPYAGSHSTSGSKDSTGFEHTFVGQKYNGGVKGLHNWIRFFELEQAGNVTYTDYMNQTIFDGDGVNKGSVLKFSYDWEDVTKDNGTMFIGTSPELEMALYTVCFFARPNVKCPVQLNGKQFTISTMDHNRLRVMAVANPNI